MSRQKVICFGEILWDVFPDRKVIGGAPLNVALRLQSFGVPVAIVSCVGNDENGEQAIKYLTDNGMPLDWVVENNNHRTGEVLIELDDHGSARYEIKRPVAWDFIPLTEALIEMVKQAPFFVFGSLALRGAMNQNTLAGLLSNANISIFDVNLRAPHYDVSMIYELMQRANVIKMNDEELLLLCEELGGPATNMKDQIQWLEQVTQTQTICVTRGGDGAMLYFENKFHEHSGFTVEVKDTVGAGDSFLATLINELFIKQNNPETSLEMACAVGGLVASRAGANCKVSKDEVSDFISTTM